jgi:hypothetical protein
MACIHTLAGIGYYSRDLDISDFGWHRLLWLEFGHQQFWPKVATMAETSLGFFFFQKIKRELGGWYLPVEETISGNVACHPNKERDSRGCKKRNNSSIG